MSTLTEVIAVIETQQPKERSAVWMVGEQLKDICREDPSVAEILLTDLLHNPEMTLAAAEKKIAEQAKKNKVDSCGCVTPAEAEEILRTFFGLGDSAQSSSAKPKILDLADFL